MGTILIVGDNDFSRRFMNRLIENLGHQLVEARSITGALKLVKKQRPDLILLDWVLGRGRTGINLLKILKSRPMTQDIPVIMVSGQKETPGDAVLAQQAGAELFLAKHELAQTAEDREAFAKRINFLLGTNQNICLGNIAVLEDDPEFAKLVRSFLSSKGHVVWTTDNPRKGLDRIRETNPDLVILDLSLPGMDGLEVCAQLKDDPQTRAIPILILTARVSSQAQRLALEYSADHYLTKPLENLDLFHSWVSALLRRWKHHPRSEKLIRVGDFLTIDVSNHKVTLLDRTITDLPAKSFRLLCELAGHAGKTLSRRRLISSIWNGAVRDREVDKVVNKLKLRLGKIGNELIECDRGIGYRMLAKIKIPSSAYATTSRL